MQASPFRVPPQLATGLDCWTTTHPVWARAMSPPDAHSSFLQRARTMVLSQTAMIADLCHSTCLNKHLWRFGIATSALRSDLQNSLELSTLVETFLALRLE